MSNPVDPVQAGQTPASPVTQAAQTASTPSASQAASNQAAANTSFTSMNALQRQAPTVYKAMMDNIALGMIGNINHHLQNLKMIREEGERNDEK